MSASSADLRSVAMRYAKALFELAGEKKQLDAVQKELNAVASALAASREFRQLIINPVLSAETQTKAVDAILAKMGLSALTKQFFGVVAQNRRLAIIPQVAKRFSALLAESRNETTAEVISAYPLTAGQLKTLKTSLIKATGHADIHLVTKEKSDILGGLIIKVDGKMFDNSIASKMARLSVSLKSGSFAN